MGDYENIWTTKVRQHPERAVPERAQEFLISGQVAHVGFEFEGRPYVIPMLYEYSVKRPDRIYLHSGPASRMLNALAPRYSGLRDSHAARRSGLFARRQVSLG